MEYEIKLSGTNFDDGSIDLDRLELLAQHLKDIAKGALQMRLLGTSAKHKGRETAHLNDALRIKLRGIKDGSTILELECEPFKNTLKYVQGHLFRQEILEQLPDQTPVALIMASFSAALDPENDGSLLDRDLLQSLQSFKKVFVNGSQQIAFSNRGSVPDVKLQLADFDRIRKIEESIPKPQQVVISGLVEELKFSKAKVTFIPDRGSAITGFLGEGVAAAEMAKYWGQKVTIRGTAHFKPNGRMAYVQIAQVALAQSDDDYFSRPVKSETTEQQIARQIREKGNRNRWSEFVGILADAEGDFENDLKMLRE